MSSDQYVLAEKNHRFMVEKGVLSTCLTCRNWHKEDETCGSAGARPPAEVIVFGCNQWDDIPF